MDDGNRNVLTFVVTFFLAFALSFSVSFLVLRSISPHQRQTTVTCLGSESPVCQLDDYYERIEQIRKEVAERQKPVSSYCDPHVDDVRIYEQNGRAFDATVDKVNC